MRTNQTTNLVIPLLFLAVNEMLATDFAINRSGSQVILSWPLASTNDFYLQPATNLSVPIAWNNTIEPATNGSDLVVSNETANTSSFYRLQAWEILFDGTNTTGYVPPQPT